MAESLAGRLRLAAEGFAPLGANAAAMNVPPAIKSLLLEAAQVLEGDFEPTDSQVAWAMNLIGPVPVKVQVDRSGHTVEGVLEQSMPVETLAAVVRNAISAAQHDVEDVGDPSPLLQKVASTKGKHLFGADGLFPNER